VMRRADLFAGRAGGFHVMAPDEAEYQSLPGGMLASQPLAAPLQGPIVLSTCGECHVGEGIASVNTYTHRMSGAARKGTAQLLPATDPSEGDAWQTILGSPGPARFEWPLLRGLIEAENSTS
jgi:hypothetical protein